MYLTTHPMGKVLQKKYTHGKNIALKRGRHYSGFLHWTENLRMSTETRNNVT